MLKLITFDLDDTLWPLRPLIQHAEQAMLDWLAQHAPQLILDVGRWSRLREKHLRANPNLRHQLSTLRRQILQEALQQAGYSPEQAEDLADAAFEAFLDARHAVQLYPDASDVLEILARTHTLGVITNGNANIQRLGLHRYFDFHISAEQLGIGKPALEPFRQALRLGGATPTQALHIGDHPLEDIQGAQAAGWQAVWFNPEQKPWSATDVPPPSVRRLGELPNLVATLCDDFK